MVEMKLVPVETLNRIAAVLDDPKAEHPHDVSYLIEEVRSLAASPQAPARDGGDYTSTSGYEAKLIDGQWRVGMAGNLDCIHDAEITIHKHISDEWAETLSKRIAAALTPREEAPAEGAGELDALSEAEFRVIYAMRNEAEKDFSDIQKAILDAFDRENAEPDYAAFVQQTKNAAKSLSAIWNLRARTSEPEAGELKPQVRDISETLSAFTVMADHFGLSPSPATADKLRVAVEALKKWPCGSCSDGSYKQRTKADGLQIVTCKVCNGTRLHPTAAQALATLNEEGK